MARHLPFEILTNGAWVKTQLSRNHITNEYSFGKSKYLFESTEELAQALYQFNKFLVSQIDKNELIQVQVLNEKNLAPFNVIVKQFMWIGFSKVGSKENPRERGYLEKYLTFTQEEAEEVSHSQVMERWLKQHFIFAEQINALLGLSPPPEPTANPSPIPPLKVKQSKVSSPVRIPDAAIIEKLHQELKGYFSDKEEELLEVLRGESLDEKLHFPAKQNQLAEVFRRMSYNGLITGSFKEIQNWLCDTFTYQYAKGEKSQIRDLSPQCSIRNPLWERGAK